MRAIELARAIADPEHVGGGIVPVAAGGIDARHRLLVVEQQRFVAGVEIGGAQLRHGFRRDAARFHEFERFGNSRGQALILFAGRRACDEAQHPTVHIVQIGITAGCERAHQIERRRGLRIRLHHALRIGHARFCGEFRAVDDVAAIGRQRHAIARFVVFRARLCELARDAADLHHRHTGGEGQHHRHLQQHAEGVADIVGVEFGEAFGAIAALQQESLALGDLGQRRHQIARLAREHQRRMGLQALFDGGQRRRIRVFRHLTDRLRTPA